MEVANADISQKIYIFINKDVWQILNLEKKKNSRKCTCGIYMLILCKWKINKFDYNKKKHLLFCMNGPFGGALKVGLRNIIQFFF